MENFMSPGISHKVLGARSVSHQGLRAVANPEVGKIYRTDLSGLAR